MSRALFTGINHICIVTGDIEKTIRTWSDKYGIGPWRLYTKDASNMTSSVDGEPTEFGMRVGLSRIGGDVGVEIIQPLDDRSPYAASLSKHNGADHIHHVSMKVENYRHAIERLDRFDFQKPLEATFSGAPGVESLFEGTYFSTEADLGFIVEISHAPDGFEMPPAESVYPPSGE